MPRASAYVPHDGPIVTRAEAKAAGATRYFTGKPCPKGVRVRNRRARKKGNGGRHTAAQIRGLLVRQRYKCPFCPADLRQGFHADHIMPLALGGSNDISNIQLLCPPCNDSKGYSHPVAWAQKKRGRLL